MKAISVVVFFFFLPSYEASLALHHQQNATAQVVHLLDGISD